MELDPVTWDKLSFFFFGTGCGALVEMAVEALMFGDKKKEEREAPIGIPLFFFLLGLMCRALSGG